MQPQSQLMAGVLAAQQELFIQQKRELIEVLVDWETSNNYVIMDAQKTALGFIAERKGSLWHKLRRMLLRSHRPLEIDIFDQDRRPSLHLSRKFFFFFSDLFVSDAQGRSFGSVHRRFGIIYKKYDLIDEHGRLFATVKSPLWRLWTFPLYEATTLRPVGSISKKWGGVLREVFTDADTFRIDFGTSAWRVSQKAVILAAAVSIDFDFFENNQGNQGFLNWG